MFLLPAPLLGEDGRTLTLGARGAAGADARASPVFLPAVDLLREGHAHSLPSLLPRPGAADPHLEVLWLLTLRCTVRGLQPARPAPSPRPVTATARCGLPSAEHATGPAVRVCLSERSLLPRRCINGGWCQGQVPSGPCRCPWHLVCPGDGVGFQAPQGCVWWGVSAQGRIAGPCVGR